MEMIPSILSPTKAETALRTRLALSANTPVGGPLHLAEMMLSQIEKLREALKPRPASEYHEDMGTVLWWRLESEPPPLLQSINSTVAGSWYPRWAGEPPYVGSPLDCGHPISFSVSTSDGKGGVKVESVNTYVGGWHKGYYTHFTPIVVPELPR